MPRYRDGQSLTGCQQPGGCKFDAASCVVADGIIFSLFALDSGVSNFIDDPGAWGKLDDCFCPFDDEIPIVSGHIPIQLVKIVEETDLSGGLVNDGVRVFARGEKNVFAADVNYDAVADIFRMERLLIPIFGDFENFKFDPNRISVQVFIFGGKCPENAPLNFIASAENFDCFGDDQIAILMHGNVTVVVDDFFDFICAEQGGGCY